MTRPPNRPEPLRYQVFRGTDALAEGLLSRNQLRTLAWVRLLRDVYADSRLRRTHGLMCRAAAVAMPEGALIAGPSAAWLHGVESAARPDSDVHVIKPSGAYFAPIRGVVVHSGVVPVADVGHRADVPCTNPVRTAWDTARWLAPGSAVPILDAMLRLGLLDAEELALFAKAQLANGARGSVKAGAAVDLADPGAASPAESRLRVRFVLAGLPRPVTQHAILMSNGLVLHPDLAWPAYKVGVEYDGEYHAGRAAMHLDRRRLNLLAAAGWMILHATSERMGREFPALLREVRTVMRSRGWRPGA